MKILYRNSSEETGTKNVIFEGVLRNPIYYRNSAWLKNRYGR